MAQDHGLCRKRKSKSQQVNRRTGRHCRPVLQLPTGQSCSLQTCCLQRSWRTWNEQGAKQNEQHGGKMRWAVGMAWQRWQQANTKPAEQATAGGHSRRTLRPAQASRNNSQQMAGLAAKQQPPMKLAGLSPCSAGRWRECGGAGHSRGGLRPT